MSKFNYKKKYGYGYVEYKSPTLNFTIYQPPGSSGHVEVKDRGRQIFVDESGNHKDRIKALKDRTKQLKREVMILENAAITMEAYKYDIPQ